MIDLKNNYDRCFITNNLLYHLAPNFSDFVMAQFFEIHPDNPQRRLIKQAVAIIDRGGLVIYPTDSSYALGCHIGDKNAMERIQRIRRTDSKHHFTLVCSDLSEIGTYAKVDNSDYRLMKSLTPGPYTFLLPATSVVPRRLMNPKRKTIGVRVPDNHIVQALLSELGQPIMSSTLIPPGATEALDDAVEIRLDRLVCFDGLDRCPLPFPVVTVKTEVPNLYPKSAMPNPKSKTRNQD